MNTATTATTDPFRAPPSFEPPPSIGPVAAFWRFRAWTVPITIVVGLLAGYAAYATSASSTATTILYLTDPRGNPVFSNGSTNPADLERYARQRAEFAQSANVLSEAADLIDEQRVDDPSIPNETAETLDDIVDAIPTPTSDVQIDCTDTEPERALRACIAVADRYIVLTDEEITRQADEQIDVLLLERDRVIADPNSGIASITEIDGRIAEIRREAVLFASGVEFVEPAKVEENSRIAPMIQFGLAGLLFAAFAMAALAWFRAGRKPVVSSGLEATSALHAPLLGEVLADPLVPFAPATPPGPAYQLLATSLGAVHPDGGIVLAGSPTQSGNTAETIARVATASAREGRRVLVLDSDLDSRSVSELFGETSTSGGLTELLAGEAGFEDVQRTIGVGGDAWLDLVTGGGNVDDSSSLLRSQYGRESLASFRSDYDLVLVAIPPLLTAPDGSALASTADGVIMVVDRGAATRELDAVRQRLEVLRTPIIGVVFDHRSGDHGR